MNFRSRIGICLVAGALLGGCATVKNPLHETVYPAFGQPLIPDVQVWKQNRAGTLHGNAIGIKKLLAEGSDPNQKDAAGDTALHLAARDNIYNVVCALIDGGASPTNINKKGNTPLDEAMDLYIDLCAKQKKSMGANSTVKRWVGSIGGERLDRHNLAQGAALVYNRMALAGVPAKVVNLGDRDFIEAATYINLSGFRVIVVSPDSSRDWREEIAGYYTKKYFPNPYDKSREPCPRDFCLSIVFFPTEDQIPRTDLCALMSETDSRKRFASRGSPSEMILSERNSGSFFLAMCGEGQFKGGRWLETGSSRGHSGAIGLGLDSTERYLLVVSDRGRGLTDLQTGKTLGRDNTPPDDTWYDATNGTAQGIGICTGQTFKLYHRDEDVREDWVKEASDEGVMANTNDIVVVTSNGTHMIIGHPSAVTWFTRKKWGETHDGPQADQ